MNCVNCFDEITKSDLSQWDKVLTELGTWSRQYAEIKKMFHSDCYANEFFEHKGFDVFWRIGE